VGSVRGPALRADADPVVSGRTVTGEAVLDAALTVFATRGYHGTAMSEIAAALGIRTPSLYNHMRGKHELLETIIERTLGEVLADFHAAVEGVSDPAERLRRATRVYALRHATHRRAALVVNRDTTSLDEPALSRLRARRREHEREVRAIILDGTAEGSFPVESAALASFAILEMCVSIARWFRDGGELTAAEVADTYSAFALRIACTGSGGTGPQVDGYGGPTPGDRAGRSREGVRVPATETRAAVTSEAVVDAALTLFAQYGYHGTALSQIAEMLGVRTPSLYNHMRSKHELLRTIVDRTTAGVLADFHDAVDGVTDPVERLHRATLVYARRHATHRREAIVVNRDTASLEEPHRSELQARRREHEHAMRQIISDGAEAGVFHVESPALASFAIREMCVSIARWFREDGPLPAEQVADQYSLFALRIAGCANP
jgi:AcrR family transcriptional regulator